MSKKRGDSVGAYSPYDVATTVANFDGVFRFQSWYGDHISVGDFQNVPDFRHPQNGTALRTVHVGDEIRDFDDYQIHTDYQNGVLVMVVFVAMPPHFATAYCDLNYSLAKKYV